MIAIISAILIGLVLNVEALGGFLAGVILSGQLLAVFMATAGWPAPQQGWAQPVQSGPSEG